MRLLSIVPGLLAAFACAATPCSAAEKVQRPISPAGAVVEIDGVAFTTADLQRKSPGTLFQARNALFQAERKAAEELIDDYLLTREAESQKLSVDELLKRDVYSKLTEPSEEAVRIYYEGIDLNQPYDAIRDKLADSIRQRRMARAKAAYILSLRSRAKIALLLSPPRVDLAVDNAPARGAKSPVVTLVEYADYECPYCQQIQPVVARIEAEYKDKLAFVFKDLPLPMHANAQKAAEGGRCAAAQGKFWEYHDRLFATSRFDVASLKEHARALKMDGAAFDSCLDSGSQAEAIKQNIAEAQLIRLPGTPGFFVNGRFVGDRVDYDILQKIIEEEINVASSRAAAVRAGSN